MRKAQSQILTAVRDTARGLHKAGVMNQVTLREFDQLCLPPAELLLPEPNKRAVPPKPETKAATAPTRERPTG